MFRLERTFEMNKSDMVEVESHAGVHEHLREGEVVGPLIQASIEGGSDVVGPQPNTSEGLTTAHSVWNYIKHAKDLVYPGQQFTFIPFVMITEKYKSSSAKVTDRCSTTGSSTL